MCFKKLKIPAPPPPAPAPETTDKDVVAAGDKERRRLAARYGRQSTILTGPQGASGAASMQKTLLGG